MPTHSAISVFRTLYYADSETNELQFKLAYEGILSIAARFRYSERDVLAISFACGYLRTLQGLIDP
jgi:hypothetical protein